MMRICPLCGFVKLRIIAQDPFPARTKSVLAYQISIYNLPKERNILLREAFFGFQEAFSVICFGRLGWEGDRLFPDVRHANFRSATITIYFWLHE
jgi:hypothetical protein